MGEFKEGIINGQGTVTLSDGRKYSGEFKEGKNMVKEYTHTLMETSMQEDTRMD